MAKRRTSKKLKQPIKKGPYTKRKKVIGGFTKKDRQTELERQKEVLSEEGWIFQSIDKRYLIATFLAPKQPWSRKKKIIVWAIITWFLLGGLLMVMEGEQEKTKPTVVVEKDRNKG